MTTLSQVSMIRYWRPAVPFAIVALTAAWFASREMPHTAVSRPDAPLAAAYAAPTAADSQAGRGATTGAGAVVDIFSVRTWEPPPPPPPVGAAAPPQAPALPFRFFGRIAEPGKPDVFLLLEGERIHRVRVGDAIGDRYRVVKFDGGRLFFRYRPMNVTQILVVGNAP